MPIRDEESEEESTESEESSEEDEVLQIAENNETIVEVNLEEKTRLMQLRKGFRLSSMCWDD